MNIPKCDDFVRSKITTCVQELEKNEIKAKKILSNIHFIRTVADRIVTKVDEKTVKKQLVDQLKANAIDAIDGLLAQEELAKTVAKFNLTFNLFNAEKNFDLYVPVSLSEASHLLALKTTGNLDQIEHIKNNILMVRTLYSLGMAHC